MKESFPNPQKKNSEEGQNISRRGFLGKLAMGVGAAVVGGVTVKKVGEAAIDFVQSANAEGERARQREHPQLTVQEAVNWVPVISDTSASGGWKINKQNDPYNQIEFPLGSEFDFYKKGGSNSAERLRPVDRRDFPLERYEDLFNYFRQYGLQGADMEVVGEGAGEKSRLIHEFRYEQSGTGEALKLVRGKELEYNIDTEAYLFTVLTSGPAKSLSLAGREYIESIDIQSRILEAAGSGGLEKSGLVKKEAVIKMPSNGQSYTETISRWLAERPLKADRVVASKDPRTGKTILMSVNGCVVTQAIPYTTDEMKIVYYE